MTAKHSHAVHKGQTHSEWLKYSNQSATRNDPLHPALIEAMSFLGSMGITMDVISGGQESNKPGEGTGSTRHNHGQSADVDFYKDGRKLDWNNPGDLPILQQIVRTAKSRGITGIGAGDDYMGPGRFHVGFGAPAVWGAGGKRANAPTWLVEAYDGAPAGQAPVFAAQPSTMEADGPGRVDRNPARLAWAYANGRMTPEDAAVYEQGVAEGVFPKAERKEQQPDPLSVYAMTAMRPRAPFQPVPLSAGQIRNATPFGKV